MARVLPMRPRGAPSATRRRAASTRPRSTGKGARTGSSEEGSRPLWRGFLSFGLVQLPIELFAAESVRALDFDLLDRRDMAPIGYRKFNKLTGEEVADDEVVRGVEIERDRHVVVTDEEIARAAGERNRLFEIEEFVPLETLPLGLIDRPLHVRPAKSGEKIFRLLAAVLADPGRAGLGTIVLRTRERLAALVSENGGLSLLLLRWPNELRPAPPPPQGPPPKPRETEVARRLVDEMSGEFRPDRFEDRFEKELLALVRRRARSGKVTRAAPVAEREATNVVDLVALLERSVAARRKAPAKVKPRGRRRA